MRYSKQRELVMQTVQNLCDHPTAEEIYDAAVKECPGLSLGTVYRNLNSLVDAGRVRRVSIPGKADRFDHTLPWHSHLYCTVCGSVTDAEVDEKQVMKLVKNQKGYVQDCAVVLIGVCEACCEKQAHGTSCPERINRVYYREGSFQKVQVDFRRTGRFGPAEKDGLIGIH